MYSSIILLKLKKSYSLAYNNIRRHSTIKINQISEISHTVYSCLARENWRAYATLQRVENNIEQKTM